MIAAAGMFLLIGQGATETPSRLFSVTPCLCGQCEAIGPAEYRAALKKIQALAESGDMEELHDAVRRLRAVRIRYGDAELPTDPTALGPLAEAKNPGAARTA